MAATGDEESLEPYIRQHSPYEKLPKKIQQKLNNSKDAWQREVLQYSIGKQLRWSEGLVRQYYSDEKKYYEQLVRQAREGLVLYPYHVSDILIRGLRISPYVYYLSMIHELLAKEKSYDSLPNFTARDCVRLLGIGRNEYIDIVNHSKALARNPLWSIVARKKNLLWHLLPSTPVASHFEPWWIVNFGFFRSDDSFTEEEQQTINRLIQRKYVACELDWKILGELYRKDVIYFDVPIQESDCVSVPPLEGFVMNRVLGDYFETLLYKLFVSLDENTTILELSNLLQIDLQTVKDAVSVYCRLGFAFKKGVEVFKNSQESSRWHPSWNARLVDKMKTSRSQENINIRQPQSIFNDVTEKINSGQKRIGFLFDSTLTAFLMMGNLSPGLKNHAVTMFEVGKLSDESLDSFMSELSIIPEESEGDAQRYFDHAITLYKTLKFLRKNENLMINNRRGVGLDLIRYESLQSLDTATSQRVLAKNYDILISMAPISVDCRTLRSSIPIHIGPPIPEANSIWFKLYLYQQAMLGPPSVLFIKGARIKRIPPQFKTFEKILLTPWEHEAQIVSYSNCLIVLNEMLCQSPVLIQGYCSPENESRIKYIPFPFEEKAEEGNALQSEPYFETLLAIQRKMKLETSCGFIKMVHLTESESPYGQEQWTPFEIQFGIPLFDEKLNKEVCDKITNFKLFETQNLHKHSKNMRELVIRFLQFISNHRNIQLNLTTESSPLYPTHTLLFNGNILSKT